MAELKTMYPGVANSPETFLKEALTIDGTIMYLADGSVLGEIPTLAVIGEGQQAETVLVTSTRSDGGFAINRGVEGPKKAWTKATTVARNWTNKDYETLVDNIKRNDASVSSLRDTLTDQVKYMMFYTDDAVEYKVDKIDGKGLSTNDYDDAAKKKVDAIPPDPKYTDTVPDLSPYAKKSDINRNMEILDDRFDKVEVGIGEMQAYYVPKTDIVNDLTTGGADKALSAEQGKTLFTYADDGKKSIADAIVGKGVDATKSDSFGVLADKISKIKTGYGVGEEISSENVEEVKVFHQHENESKLEVTQKKLEYNQNGKKVECGEPSALTVNDKNHPYVGTLNGEICSLDEFLNFYYVEVGVYPLTAISTRPNGEIYTAYDGSESIFLSINGITEDHARIYGKWWHTSVGSKWISAMAPKYYYLYCSADNKVVELTNGFKKSWEFTEHTAQVNAVAVDNGWNVYSGGADNKVFKISDKGEKIWEFTLHTAAVNALAVDNDGYLYSGGADCKIYKISPDGKRVWQDKTDSEITAIAVGPDGGILCGTTGSTLYMFYPDVAPKETMELVYKDKSGAVFEDGDVVDIVVANDGSIFYVTKKAKVITRIKYGAYTTSYKIIK